MQQIDKLIKKYEGIIFIGLMIIWVAAILNLAWQWYFLPTKVVAQQNCGGVLPKAEGLVSAFSIDPNFASSTGCISGSLSYIPLNEAKIQINDYDSLFTKFYTLNTTSTKIILTPGTYSSPISGMSANTLIYTPGDLVLSGNVLQNTFSANLLVFFVDGSLWINSNITESTYFLANGGLVFVVKGKIYINGGPAGSQVTTVSGVLISQGLDVGAAPFNPINTTICTTCGAAPNKSSNSLGPGAFDQQLKIFGGLVSINNQSPTKTILFNRFYTSGNLPAEEINFVPRYLNITRPVFGEKVRILQEI